MRLNKTHRTEIIENATHDQEIKLEQAKHELKNLLYHHIQSNLPDFIVKCQRYELWNGALTKHATVLLKGYTSHSTFRLNWKGEVSAYIDAQIKMGRELPCGCHRGHRLLEDFPHNNEIAACIRKIEKLADNLVEANKVLQSELSRVATLKQLKEQWPECEEFLPEELKGQAKNLPAKPIDAAKINSLISTPAGQV